MRTAPKAEVFGGRGLYAWSMRVHFQTAYPLQAASPRVRIAEFERPLASHGVELRLRSNLSFETYSNLTSGNPAGKLAALTRGTFRQRGTPDADLFGVHRLSTLAPVPGLDRVRNLDVYDFDDALFLGSIGAAHGSLGNLIKREARQWRTHVARARTVIAGNNYLADAATRAGASHVEVIPSCIDPSGYRSRANPAGGPIIGWIGSGSTQTYLGPVIEGARRARRILPDLSLLLIGSQLHASEPWIEERPWSISTFHDDLANIDFGVMPLPDTPWARGKCAYKLLQYFASEKPAVGSPVGVSEQILRGGSGICALSSSDYADAFVALGSDPVGAAERGTAAKEFVIRNYSYDRWAPELAKLFQELVD